jgi:hypothetical protein
MTRSHHIAREAAIGGAAYTAFLGAWFGALVLWSRRCASRRPYAIGR